MKKLAEKRWVRVLAGILFVLFLLLSTAASLVVNYGRWGGWYQAGSETGFENTWACKSFIIDGIYYVADMVRWENDLTREDLGSYSGTAFSYVIRDANRKITADTREENSVFVDSLESTLNLSDEEDPEQADDQVFTVDGYVNLPVEPYGGCYTEYVLFTHFYALRYYLLAAKVLFLILAGLALLILCFGAAARGREKGLRPILRLPADLLLILGILAWFLLRSFANNLVEWVFESIHKYTGSWPYSIYNTSGYALHYLVGILLVSFLLWYISGQLGAGCLRKRLLLPRLMRRIPGWIVILGITAVHAVLLFLLGEERYLFLPILLLLDALAAAYLLISQRQADRIQRAARELASGNLSYKVESKRLFHPWHTLGEDLNRIGDGLAEAVEERMRSERMKTELITNVSHDLKTPLTSLINYIELLKSPELDDKTRTEYLEILDKQSAKLKKLTEDVVEASKAASGAVTVHLEPINAVELLDQVVGEYSDRMNAAGVVPVLDLPEHPAMILGDSTLLGRVLENLITNIVKYAQPDTRAYFDLNSGPEAVIIMVKNISSAPLNISADELMERFVRGDSSRHSEGSGLGLSIAKSLTELMGGSLRLILDGDLFKAELSFPPYKRPEGESNNDETSTVG